MTTTKKLQFSAWLLNELQAQELRNLKDLEDKSVCENGPCYWPCHRSIKVNLRMNYLMLKNTPPIIL